MRKMVVMLAFVLGVAVGGLFMGSYFTPPSQAYSNLPRANELFSFDFGENRMRASISILLRSKYSITEVIHIDEYRFGVVFKEK